MKTCFNQANHVRVSGAVAGPTAIAVALHLLKIWSKLHFVTYTSTDSMKYTHSPVI